MNSNEFPDYLDDLMAGYQRAQILMTALGAGVFEQLEVAANAETVGEACGWDPKGARMLLDGLVALELVEKTDGGYRNRAGASACLVPGAPLDQTHILLHKSHGWNTWARLEEAVRTGTGIPRERKKRPPEELRAFILGMDDIGRQSAQSILGAVDLSGHRHILDIGAGPGTYSIAFLNAHAGMRATLFDVPDVIPIAKEQVEKAGLTDRTEFIAGDFTETSIGAGYDLILVSNIIHSYAPDTNRELVRQCHEALDPGGRLIIKDFLVDPGRSGPAFSLIFALHMLLHTESGDTYSQEDVAQWTTEAGFGPGELVDLTPQTRLWLARKG